MTFISQLPPSAGKIERTLEQVFREEIRLIERDIRDFLNPWKCRADLLPYLAWELSVDDWNDDWDESVKRDVCANAIKVHLYKGTRGGVEAALDALGVTADITEWYEASPKLEPGRFELMAWANKNLSPEQTEFLSDDLYQRIESAVKNAKNTRSHLDMKVGAAFGPETLTTGCTITNPVSLTRCDTDAVQEPLKTGIDCGAGIAGTAVTLTRQTANAAMDTQPESVALAIAGVTKGYAVLKLQMEAV